MKWKNFSVVFRHCLEGFEVVSEVFAEDAEPSDFRYFSLSSEELNNFFAELSFSLLNFVLKSIILMPTFWNLRKNSLI